MEKERLMPERGGMSRREALRKGALATGMIWAAPAITTYGARAVAQSAATALGAEFTFTASGHSCSPAGPTGFSGPAWPGMPGVAASWTDASATCDNTGANVVSATINLISVPGAITHALAQLDGGLYLPGVISGDGRQALFVAGVGVNARMITARIVVDAGASLQSVEEEPPAEAQQLDEQTLDDPKQGSSAEAEEPTLLEEPADTTSSTATEAPAATDPPSTTVESTEAPVASDPAP